jgi:hypothetical protein
MNLNPSLFIMVFLAFFCFVAWNMGLPTIFWGESIEKDALIVDSKVVPSGRGHVQLATLAYPTDDSTYLVKCKLASRNGIQTIGSKILVEHSVSTPTKHRIEEYYPGLNRCTDEVYLKVEREIKESISLCNGILTKSQHSMYSQRLHSEYYRYSEKQDTLRARPLFDSGDIPELQFHRLEISDDLTYLTNLHSGKTYRTE